MSVLDTSGSFVLGYHKKMKKRVAGDELMIVDQQAAPLQGAQQVAPPLQDAQQVAQHQVVAPQVVGAVERMKQVKARYNIR